MTRLTFRDAAGNETQVDADLSRASRVWAGPIDHPTVLDREAIDEIEASESRGIIVITPDHTNHSHLLQAMARFAVDAGQVLHILPASEAREWEADGHTIRELPPKKAGDFAPDHVYNIPKLTDKQLRALVANDPPEPSPYMIRNFYGQDGMAAVIKKRQETEARRQRGECRYTYPEPKRRRKQR